MKNQWHKSSSVGAALCVAPTLLAQPQYQPQFKGMGKPPPGLYGQSNTIQIHAIDGNGTVFGTNFGTPCAWSLSTQYTSMKPLVAGGYAEVGSVTTNGEIMFGIASDTPTNTRAVPVQWKSLEGPPVAIQGFPANWGCESTNCNADGTVAAGTTYDSQGKDGIFIWRAGVRKNMGWEFITQFPPGIANAAISDLSADGTIGFGGTVNAGISAFQGLRWTKWGGLELMGDLPGGPIDSGFSLCSADGLVAGGRADDSFEIGVSAARWDARNLWQKLPMTKPLHTTSACGIDDSGWVAIGASAAYPNNQDQTAFLWNSVDGTRAVQEILVSDYGLTAAVGWKLTLMQAISPDSRYISGLGINPKGKGEAWWAEIRPFCYADCDRSSTPKGGAAVLDIDDFICYITHFALDDLYANCNNDADLDINDFICFQTAYALGC